MGNTYHQVRHCLPDTPRVNSVPNEVKMVILKSWGHCLPGLVDAILGVLCSYSSFYSIYLRETSLMISVHGHLALSFPGLDMGRQNIVAERMSIKVARLMAAKRWRKQPVWQAGFSAFCTILTPP